MLILIQPWVRQLKRHLLKNEQAGSAMLAVVIVFSILLILGLSLIGLALARHRYALSQINSNSSEYLAEAGLNEAYAKLAKKIETATYKASVNLQASSADYFTGKTLTDTQIDTFMSNVFANGYDNGLSIQNDGFFQELCNELYQPDSLSEPNKYTSYSTLVGDLTDYSLYAAIPHETPANTDFSEKRFITVTAISVKLEGVDQTQKITGQLSQVLKGAQFSSSTLPSAIDSANIGKRIEAIDVTFQSTNIAQSVTADPNIKPVPRTITATLRIKAPEPLYTRKIQSRTPLMNEALFASKDINVFATNSDSVCNLNISASGIYAYGSPNGGGFRCGTSSGKAKVNLHGELDTAGCVQTGGSGSQLAILGDVFCNTMIIPEKDVPAAANDLTGCTITVGNNIKPFSVNTQDNLELDGESSHIGITGYLYAFNDGSEQKDVNDYAKFRSAIVINSSDIGGTDGSSLDIHDPDVGANVSAYDAEYPLGSVVAGSVYVNTETPYRTGDSVSVKNNFAVYQEENIPADAVTYSGINTTFSGITTSGYISTDHKSTYNFFDHFNTFDPGSASSNWPVYMQRAAYALTLFAHDANGYYDKRYLFNTDGVKVSNMIYSTGNYIDDSSPNKYNHYMNNVSGSSLDIKEIIVPKMIDYRYRTCMFGDQNYAITADAANKTFSTDIGTDIGNGSALFKNLEAQIESGTEGIIGKLLFAFSGSSAIIQLDDVINKYNDDTSDIPVQNVNKELALVNNSARNVFIVENVATYSGLPSNVKKDNDIVISVANAKNSTISGIVITKGDMYIVGDVNYSGALICDGSINFTGDGTINITDNPAYVSRKIYDSRLGIRSALKNRAYEKLVDCKYLNNFLSDTAENTGAAEFVFEDFYTENNGDATPGAIRMKMPIAIIAWHADQKGAL